MVKWFCDVCKLEIIDPEPPVRVAAYRCRKGRDDAEIGWSESDDIFKVFCHVKCADELEKFLRSAIFATERERRLLQGEKE